MSIKSRAELEQSANSKPDKCAYWLGFVTAGKVEQMIGKLRARISVLSVEPSLLKYSLNSLQFFGLCCASPNVFK